MIFEKIPEKIKELIQKGEGIDTEFKTAQFELGKNTFDTVCAFLNRRGGHLLLGVKNNGAVEGVIEDSVQNIIDSLTTGANDPQKLNPTYYLSPNAYKDEKDNIIVHVFVPESSQVHSTKGRVFDRNEDGDMDVTGTDQVGQLYFRKKNIFSENKIYPYVTMKEFREDLFQRVRALSRSERPNHPWLELSDEELLISAGLFRSDYQTGEKGYTLAAVLIFGKDEVIHNILPYYKTDALLRVENEDRYDDRDDIRTNLIESYDRLMAFVRKHLPDKFYIENDQRVSLRDRIFREVVANILIHREYLNTFPARFIIRKGEVNTENWNRAYGAGDIDPAHFAAVPKNPVIAKFFRQIGRADELGSGVRNTFRYCKFYVNDRHPVFSEGDVFKTYIPAPVSIEGAIEGTIEGANEGTIEGAIEGTIEGVIKGASEKNKQKHKDLLLAIIYDEGQRTNDYARSTGFSMGTTERYIRNLRKAGVIEFVGDAFQTGGYFLTESFRKKLGK